MGRRRGRWHGHALEADVVISRLWRGSFQVIRERILYVVTLTRFYPSRVHHRALVFNLAPVFLHSLFLLSLMG